MPGAIESPADAYEQARAWATHWSQTWFRDDDGADLFTIATADAGWATHVEAFLILQRFALATLAQDVERTRPSLTRGLKARGLDRAVRAIAMRVGRQPMAERRRFATIIEMPTPSMLEPGALVAATLGPDACATATSDPRAAAVLRHRGIVPHRLSLPLNMELRALAGARREASRAWEARCRQPPSMTLAGRDVADRALEALRPLATRSMPWVAVEREAVERYFDAVQPAAITIGSDQHRIGRLAVDVARRHDIATLVLQHGLPQAPIGYLPVIADAVAVWSPESASWFASHETPRERLHQTGNPRLDLIAHLGPPQAGACNLLLALSPTSRATNQGLVAGAVDATRLIPDARLVVKFHPGGQADWAPIERTIRTAADSRVTVRRHEPLYPLLAEASITLVHRSSVAVESLAAGRPVIVYRAGNEPTTADLELRGVNLPVATSAAQLAAMIAELSAPDAVRGYFDERQVAIEAVTGPLGGSNAARIAALLEDLAIGRSSGD